MTINTVCKTIIKIKRSKEQKFWSGIVYRYFFYRPELLNFSGYLRTSHILYCPGIITKNSSQNFYFWGEYFLKLLILETEHSHLALEEVRKTWRQTFFSIVTTVVLLQNDRACSGLYKWWKSIFSSKWKKTHSRGLNQSWTWNCILLLKSNIQWMNTDWNHMRSTYAVISTWIPFQQRHIFPFVYIHWAPLCSVRDGILLSSEILRGK